MPRAPVGESVASYRKVPIGGSYLGAMVSWKKVSCKTSLCTVWFFRVAVIVSVLSVSQLAWAKHSAHLIYERGDGAETCPDEAGLRNAVAERLGYDPFDEAAVDQIRVRLRRDRNAWRASIQLDDGGAPHGERVLSSTSPACNEIAGAVALTIALAIDPMAGLNPPPSRARSPSTAPTAPDSDPRDLPPGYDFSAPRVAASPAPKSAPLEIHAGAAAFVSFGSVPDTSGGTDVFFGVRGAKWRGDVEGRVVLPASTSIPSGAGVRASLAVGILSPCYQPTRALRLCALLELGAMRGEGISAEQTRHGSSFYSAVGVRVGVEIPIVSHLSLDLRLDGLTPLTTTTLGLANVDVWTTPPIAGAIGAGITAHFP